MGRVKEWYCKRQNRNDQCLIASRTAHEAIEIFLSRGGPPEDDSVCICILVRPANRAGEWRTFEVYLPVPHCRGAQHVWANPQGVVRKTWKDETGTTEHRVCRKCGWYRCRHRLIQDPLGRSERLSYVHPNAVSRKWIARQRTRVGPIRPHKVWLAWVDQGWVSKP